MTTITKVAKKPSAKQVSPPRYLRIPLPLWERIVTVAETQQRKYNDQIIRALELGLTQDEQTNQTQAA